VPRKNVNPKMMLNFVKEPLAKDLRILNGFIFIYYRTYDDDKA